MLVIALASLGTAQGAAQPAVADAFERITPEQAGYDPARLDELRTFLKTSGSDSLLLLHDGKVFFEWGDIRKKLLIHSMRKALLSSLYGIHESRGEIDLNATLAELGIDDAPQTLTAMERSARLVDLLKSRSGVYITAAAESEGMAQSRPARGSHVPGTHYYYNNWDFNVAGAVLERRIGRRVFDAFDAEIARPLGMLDWQSRITVTASGDNTINRSADGFYSYERERSRYPAYHFRLSAHDLALYGQLFLQRGEWRGQQLVPAEWIDRSTQPYSIVDAGYGLAYGMLWDVLLPEPGEAQPSFFHTGVGVHMLGVYPKHHLVMVHRVDTETGSGFNDGDLYGVIRRVHGARVRTAAASNSGSAGAHSQ
ncbi:serine hydrolase [Silanimonas sp.]|uniref:serine hydrolase domain-containing protein n=1 Tax=Silanimonas sp. TaxID=1929290 RepID=UPI0022BC769D|nr:serine hydrolase [Silanimonas sp.]MCZ8062634.1 serine hydrolase [Silanimonas sp.]